MSHPRGYDRGYIDNHSALTALTDKILTHTMTENITEEITEEASVSATADQFMTTAAVLVTDPTEGIIIENVAEAPENVKVT